MTYPNHKKEELGLKEEISEAIAQMIEEKIINPNEVQRRQMVLTMYRTLVFNRELKWKAMDNVFLVQSVEALLDIYRLRSRVYASLGYTKEFPEMIAGVDFDQYDERAAILYTQKEGRVTGTCRIVFDDKHTLPIDKNYSLNFLRKKGEPFGELSRLIIEKVQKRGLGREFRHLTLGAYQLMKHNHLTRVVSVILEEHFRLYKKFGGFEKKALLSSYGQLNKPFLISTWDIESVSQYFKKVFLGL